ncbi:MAG: hypothetical protein ABII79_02325 [bacterium]
MIRKLVVSFILLTFMLTAVMVYAQDASGPDKDKRVKVQLDGSLYKIQTPGDPTWKVAGTVIIRKSPGLSENVVITNYSAGNVTVVNTSSPDGLKPNLIIPAGDDSLITFTCNVDMGEWIFDVGDAGGAGTEAILTVKVICTTLPSLTTYGMILLALLLLGSAVFVLRRKRATVPV